MTITEITTFLKQCDPKPPYVEEPGRRNPIAGILGLLIIPGLFLYAVSQYGVTYSPIDYDCICPTFNATDWDNYPAGMDWFLWMVSLEDGKIPRESNVSDVGALEWCRIVYESYMDNLIRYSGGYPLQMQDGWAGAAKPYQWNQAVELGCPIHNTTDLDNLIWRTMAVTCPYQDVGASCSSNCFDLNDLWFPIPPGSGDARGRYPPNATVAITHKKLMGCQHGYCRVRACFGYDCRQLCTAPSVAHMLAVFGSGFGLIMGLFVNSPSGARFVFKAVQPATEGGDPTKDFLRGIRLSIFGLGYFGVIYAYLQEGQSIMKRHGALAGGLVLAHALIPGAYQYFNYLLNVDIGGIFHAVYILLVLAGFVALISGLVDTSLAKVFDPTLSERLLSTNGDADAPSPPTKRIKWQYHALCALGFVVLGVAMFGAVSAILAATGYHSATVSVSLFFFACCPVLLALMYHTTKHILSSVLGWRGPQRQGRSSRGAVILSTCLVMAGFLAVISSISFGTSGVSLIVLFLSLLLVGIPFSVFKWVQGNQESQVWLEAWYVKYPFALLGLVSSGFIMNQYQSVMAQTLLWNDFSTPWGKALTPAGAIIAEFVWMSFGCAMVVVHKHQK